MKARKSVARAKETPRGTGPGPSARRRGRPPLADKERLLDGAERAIRRHGPAVSMERIAAKAGVTKPVLFAHVGDRRALVDALAARHLARIEAAAQVAASAASPGRAQLEAVLRAGLETIAADRHLYAFVNGAGAGDKTLASTLEFARRSAAPFVAGLRAEHVRAGVDPAPAEAWGYAIVGALHMVGLWWLNDARTALDSTQLAAQLTHLLWTGMAPPAER